jgi:hypothetical protein
VLALLFIESLSQKQRSKAKERSNFAKEMSQRENFLSHKVIQTYRTIMSFRHNFVRLPQIAGASPRAKKVRNSGDHAIHWPMSVDYVAFSCPVSAGLAGDGPDAGW